MISIKDISIFNNILGYNILFAGNFDKINFKDNRAFTLARSMTFALCKNMGNNIDVKILSFVSSSLDFFETDDGDMYFDYEIYLQSLEEFKKEFKKTLSYDKFNRPIEKILRLNLNNKFPDKLTPAIIILEHANKYLKSFMVEGGEIVEIKILGRNFYEDDFLKWKEIYDKVKGTKYTDDMFVFRCKNGKEIYFAFDTFLLDWWVYWSDRPLLNINSINEDVNKIFKECRDRGEFLGYFYRCYPNEEEPEDRMKYKVHHIIK
jgi:hypothetical protein